MLIGSMFLRIFSQFAFKQDYPRVGFEQLTVRAVHLAGHCRMSSPQATRFVLMWKRPGEVHCRGSTHHKVIMVSERCSYVEASEYLQIKSKRYIVAEDEGEYSPSYHMLL